ncbi:MAG: tRNA (N6-isopentenyl adenosine(37)-C2)-methylthiotransferase MiaB [Chitinophagaceae bacterium]|nr:MAG: tRNA (N6-isopentenyl adenosine(37)-C2)-methylthiotransferase MiaB [Chitinophagaceae bacterium]
MLNVLNKSIDESRQGEAYAPINTNQNIVNKKFFIESYGCSMNFSDSEIIASILQNEGFGPTKYEEEADLIFLNTCSIREKAELTVRKRLTEFKKLKRKNPSLLVGILGCMAERLKNKLLDEEKLVDLVVGPDAYRTLPSLIEEAEGGTKAVNVLLSRDETYAGISPVRLNSNGVSAFVSITRGCNNMCSFCVVPFTRGRERSRDVSSILDECKDLFNNGYREVTLLGQNVDSYYFVDSATNHVTDFALLLKHVAEIDPLLRVRFSTSHPKDITDSVLFTMRDFPNICKYIHLPVQSGSTRLLQLMNRTYTREWYLSKIKRIKEIMPDCAVSSDIIAGFCTEEEQDHLETLDVMKQSAYEFSYMFVYSERPGTLAAKRYEDNVDMDTKKRRLHEIVAMQNNLSYESNKKDVGKIFEVLIEGNSKRSDLQWMGRNSQNKVMIFDKAPTLTLKKGDYVNVVVNEFTQATLFCTIVH